jgi:hypothetical protein
MLSTRAVVFAAIVAVQSAVSAPVDVSSLAVSTPALVCELDLNLLKGDLKRLSWSPNNASVHVQTLEGTDKPHDYIVTIVDGVVSIAFGEPEWAADYWMKKADFAAPGIPSLRLEVTTKNRRTKPMPFAGGLNGAYTPDPKDPVDAYEYEVTLWMVGREIGNWINGAPEAGETFGWGPAGSAALVFVDRSGRLAFLDRAKHQQTVPGVKGAYLPAWSADGTRLAFLQKTGKKKFRLMTASVGRATV